MIVSRPAKLPRHVKTCICLVSVSFLRHDAAFVNGLANAVPSHSTADTVSFCSPLLVDGYPPAVREASSSGAASSSQERKPLLMYLPGFDGTLVAPFLQLPELGTTFDVRGMKVRNDDRSTVSDLRERVLRYLKDECTRDGKPTPFYLAGESFGGILASSVARAVLSDSDCADLRESLRGLVLINPATSYPRSVLAAKGGEVASLHPMLYPFGVLSLLPLFGDAHQLPQLLRIVSSEGLPSVIDTPAREAYMGRVALSLPSRLTFMPRDTLRWRLESWLHVGATAEATDEVMSSLDLRTLIVAGGSDATLPSLEEADRLKELMPRTDVHVVDEAGHASTCGSRVDLAAVIRKRFPELRGSIEGDIDSYVTTMRTEMKKEASEGKEGSTDFGLISRYDGASLGMMPTRYMDEDVYIPWKE